MRHSPWSIIFADRLELDGRKLGGLRVAVELFEETKHRADARLLAGRFATLDVVARGVSPVAGDGFDHREPVGLADERLAAAHQPFADQPIVVDLAGPGAVGAEIVVAAVERDDGLAGRAMSAILRDRF